MEYIVLPAWFVVSLYLSLSAIILILSALLIRKDEHIGRLTRALTRRAYGNKAADELEEKEYRTTFTGNIEGWGGDV